MAAFNFNHLFDSFTRDFGRTTSLEHNVLINHEDTTLKVFVSREPVAPGAACPRSKWASILDNYAHSPYYTGSFDHSIFSSDDEACGHLTIWQADVIREYASNNYSITFVWDETPPVEDATIDWVDDADDAADNDNADDTDDADIDSSSIDNDFWDVQY